MKSISTQKNIIKAFAIALLCFSCTQNAAALGSLFGNKEQKEASGEAQSQKVKGSMLDAGQQIGQNMGQLQQIDKSAENLAADSREYKSMAKQLRQQQETGLAFFSRKNSGNSSDTQPPSPVSDDGSQANDSSKPLFNNPFAKKEESVEANKMLPFAQSGNGNAMSAEMPPQAQMASSSAENMANSPQSILQREKEVAIHMLIALSELMANEEGIIFGKDQQAEGYRMMLNEIKLKIAQTIEHIQNGTPYQAQQNNSFISQFRKPQKLERVAEVLPEQNAESVKSAKQVEDVLRRHVLMLLVHSDNIVQCLIALPGTDENADHYLNELRILIDKASKSLLSMQNN